MKFTWDERTKHRIVGAVVILSIVVIFIPTMMKQPSDRFDKYIHMSMQLPKKPPIPDVVIPSKRSMFHAPKQSKLSSPSPHSALNSKIVAIPAAPTLAKAELIADSAAKKVLKDMVVKSVKKEVYYVQVATFWRQKRADTMIRQLNKKGYTAHCLKEKNKSHTSYKVLVGSGDAREVAYNLKTELQLKARLPGFLVRHEVG